MRPGDAMGESAESMASEKKYGLQGNRAVRSCTCSSHCISSSCAPSAISASSMLTSVSRDRFSNMHLSHLESHSLSSSPSNGSDSSWMISMSSTSSCSASSLSTCRAGTSSLSVDQRENRPGRSGTARGVEPEPEVRVDELNESLDARRRRRFCEVIGTESSDS